MANIRARGRLIVGLDIGSNLFSFRDPISGEIVGFDVDVAGEVARDIFGNPSQVEYRILSSAERITALQKGEVDAVVKTMTITCDRRKLVNFSTVYLDASQRILTPRDSPITKPADLSGKRVCVARGTTSLQRIREIAPPPLAGRGGQLGRLPGARCSSGRSMRSAPTTRFWPGWFHRIPYLHIVGTQHGHAALRHRGSVGQHRAGAVRERHPGADPPRRHVEYVVPQVVNRSRARAGAAQSEVRGLMAEQPVDPDSQDADDFGPGTEPADSMVDSSAQSRPIATQAIFRPDFDDDDDEFPVHIGDTAPADRRSRRRGRRFAG